MVSFGKSSHSICSCFLLIAVFVHVTSSLIGAKDIVSPVSTTESSSTELNEIELEQFKQRNIECNIHENCTSRLFSLDTYCCMPANYCCNWFEFMLKFKSSTTTTLPYKSPSLVTIFTLLILIICLLFISYCVCILFCYYFKCGLFKKPKVVVISSSSSSNRYRHRRNYAREFDSASTEIIHHQQSQPTKSSSKENSSTRTSISSSSSLSSAASSSYSITQHRSNLQTKLKSKKSQRSSNEPPKTPIDDVTSKNHKRSRMNRDEFVSRSVDNYPLNKHRTSSSTASASASSKRSRNQQQTSFRRRREQQQQSLYADPDCYIDYENESPFLLPSKQRSFSGTTSGAGASSGVASSYSKTKQSSASVPSKHQSNNKRRRTSSNSNRQTGHNNTPKRSSSNSHQQNPTTRRRSSISSNHSYGTAVALVDIDLLGNTTSRRLETVQASSDSSSSRSSLSRLSGSSELVASRSAGTAIANNIAHVRVTQNSITDVDLIANSDTEINAASSLLLLSGGEAGGVVSNYYQDEKPPSYDDIIRQNI